MKLIDLLWDVLDPKEMRREGAFADRAIEFAIGRDQRELKRYCDSEIETVMDGAIRAACVFPNDAASAIAAPAD
ncbi:MAG TPA: hypothetical protein VFU31_12420 [Candidatus Binatia bacterium]|nr:hypothetical protein [Candidatus Binatia bacterium]